MCFTLRLKRERKLSTLVDNKVLDYLILLSDLTETFSKPVAPKTFFPLLVNHVMVNLSRYRLESDSDRLNQEPKVCSVVLT